MAETMHMGQRRDKLSWTAEFFTVFRSIRWPYITFKLPRRDMDTSPRPHNFFRYLTIGMCHSRRLWNGMCDHHRAELTVMQFTGHSLPVHHFIMARCDLHLVPYCQPSSPTWSLPITGHWNGSLPPFLEWHVWLSLSGNNCHAVHRSLSSGASLCDCTVRFFTLSHIVSQAVFYKMNFCSFKKVMLPTNCLFMNHIYCICINSLALNNLQGLICYKTKPTNIW